MLLDLRKNNTRQDRDESVFYLKYKNLDDLLKIIIYSSQSMLGVIPMLYHINYHDQQILFILTGSAGAVGGGDTIIHYFTQSERPTKKFIELKRLSGDFRYVDGIGTDGMSLYVPILELETSTFKFPNLGM